MRKILLVVAVALFFFGASSVAQTLELPEGKRVEQKKRSGGKGRAVWGYFKQFVPGVEFPAPRNVGGVNVVVGAQGVEVLAHSLVVRNVALFPGSCDLFAYDTFVANLAAGDMAFDNRRVELQNPRIPLLAICKDDEGRFLGMASAIRSFSRGYPEAKTWEFGLSDIVDPKGYSLSQGSWGNNPVYPAPYAGLERKRVEFPRKWANSMAGVQIANNSYFRIVVDIGGGGRRLIIKPGSFAYVEDALIPGYGWGIDRLLSVSWLDGERLIGTEHYSYQVSSGSMYAYQFILTPSGMRRY